MEYLIYCKDNEDLKKVINHAISLGCYLPLEYKKAYCINFDVIKINNSKIISIFDICFLSDLKKNTYYPCNEYYANEFLAIEEI